MHPATMKNYLLTAFLFLVLHTVCAQPGGGGGLLINGVYYPDGRAVDLLNDPNLKIRSFLMDGAVLLKETFLLDELRKNGGRYRISRGHTGFGISDEEMDQDGLRGSAITRRLLIQWGTHTMLIDFKEVMEQNGGGYTSTVDSLMLMDGYFIFSRPGIPDQKTQIRDASLIIRRGFTKSNLEQLQQLSRASVQPLPSLDFLKEEYLSTAFLTERGAYLLRNHQIEEATKSLETALNRGTGKPNCRLLFVMTDYFTELHKWTEAINSITLALNCKRNVWEDDYRINNLRTRAQLFLKVNRVEEAVADYQQMLRLSEEPESIQSELAEVYLNQLNNAQQAEQLLRNLLNETGFGIPGNADFNQARSLFLLGKALYAQQQFDSAFVYLELAEARGMQVSSSWEMTTYFSNLLKQHPDATPLWMCLSNAHYKRAPYLGWGDSTRIELNRALEAVNKAEQLGGNMFKINLQRARILLELKLYQEALKNINRAIESEPKKVEGYQVRYQIRSALGQTIWGNKNDPDQLIIEQLKSHPPD